MQVDLYNGHKMVVVILNHLFIFTHDYHHKKLTCIIKLTRHLHQFICIYNIFYIIIFFKKLFA